MSSTIFSGRTFKGGEDDFNAGSVGGYWTHFGENNWYLDGVVQGTWYDMDMTAARGLRDGDTDGFGSGSLARGWISVPPWQRLAARAAGAAGLPSARH